MLKKMVRSKYKKRRRPREHPRTDYVRKDGIPVRSTVVNPGIKYQEWFKKKKYKKLIKGKKKFLGSGEFSNAYSLNENIILKVNRNISLFNPQNYPTKKSREQFARYAQKEMQSEIKTYKMLKNRGLTILPNFMEGFFVGKKYYIMREGGEIPYSWIYRQRRGSMEQKRD